MFTGQTRAHTHTHTHTETLIETQLKQVLLTVTEKPGQHQSHAKL